MPTMEDMVMAWPIMGTVMVWLIMVTTVLMPTLMLTDTIMARGLLMLSPRPMPTMVIIMDTDSPTTGTVMPITVTMATLTLIMATTTARGLLMLSPLLTHSTDITTDMLHTVMLTGVTTATLMPTMATMATITESKSLSYCYFVQ